MKTKTIIIVGNRVKGYLTSCEYAEKYGIDKDTVQVWISRGKLNDYVNIDNECWIRDKEPNPDRKKKTFSEALAMDGEFAEELGKVLGMLSTIGAHYVTRYSTMTETERLKEEIRILKLENELLRSGKLKP